MSNDIELKIPVELTATRIQRAGNSIDDYTARKLAEELHEIIASYRKFFSVRFSDRAGEELSEAAEEADVIMSIYHSAMDIWSTDHDVAANESNWLYDRFDTVGADELYAKYLRVSDKITGSDIADWFDDDGRDDDD